MYNPKEIETRWYQHWMQKKYFASKPDQREPYTIVIPPPNVTGVLHMGHMLNNTIQDLLIRRARMQGKNACWVPGTDHASIATEAKVVQLLRKQGIKKSDLTREAFLAHAFEWKDKYGGIILEQLQKLGASCDWDRTRFTMEPKLSEAVIDSFIHLYKKGHLYRDKKMVNWDPAAKTTLSNEEVIFKEEQAPMCYIKYMLQDGSDYITVATVRPETIMGDVAVAVHPADERYKNWIGKTVIVPLVNRPVPVITDEGIEIEFGTGALKVTPAHDNFDYEIGKKNNLDIIDCFEDDGTISQAAQVFVGMDRFEARTAAIDQLTAEGLIIKQEMITHKVGRSERTDVVVEPRLSVQWFVKMNELVQPALNNVMNNNIQFVPDRYKNLYKHWLDNIRDWPISRQLWWGQQIPAWYDESGNYVIAKTQHEAQANYIEKYKTEAKTLTQDPDVLDTWFSSWLWPISVFDGFEGDNLTNPNSEFNYYYPTSVLVTGWDIIFFWVARMVFAGYEFTNEKPFKSVYFTGMVRDKQRRKMSKSLGNSPDALQLIDTYGADGLRFGIMSAASAGNDIVYDDKLCEQGRNFSNKIYNASKLIAMWKPDAAADSDMFAVHWMQEKVKKITISLNEMIEKFQLNEGLKMLYSVMWDDFCGSYLEWIKPGFVQPINDKILNATVQIFEDLLALLHPFMPFITEEVYHAISPREEGDDIILKAYPAYVSCDEQMIKQGDLCAEIITKIRELKARNQLKPRDAASLQIAANASKYELIKNTILKMSYLDNITFVDDVNQGGLQFVVDNIKMNLIVEASIDTADQTEKLIEELHYIKGFRDSVLKKLSNEKFVNSAPEAVVAIERKKLNDAEERIVLLENSLK
jgi:valyl-tRNA synthetase